MTIRFGRHWKEVLRRAWSVRLMLLAGALSAAEAAFPFFFDAFDRRASAAIMAALVFLALVARLLAQKGVPDA